VRAAPEASGPASRPRIDYLATGGTIASVRESAAPGAVPTLTAAQLVASVPGLDAVAEVRAAQFLQGPSTSITFADLFRLREQIAARIADGADAIVISQGTDTIEETAFALDLLWDGPAPVVVTGAMRNPSAPGGDGPANLLAAVQVAGCAQARGLGVLVVLGDEIHAARFVRKSHASSPAAFRSPLTGPIGWVSEGRSVIATRPVGRHHLQVVPTAQVPPVALLRLGLADDGRLLPVLAGLGFRGAVIEGLGGGHVTAVMVPLLRRLVAEMPVVLASRTGAGQVLRETYRFPGSEIELLELGLIPAGALDGVKARVLLALCLAGATPRDAIERLFAEIGALARS
jgi:L-asparaginase